MDKVLQIGAAYYAKGFFLPRPSGVSINQVDGTQGGNVSPLLSLVLATISWIWAFSPYSILFPQCESDTTDRNRTKIKGADDSKTLKKQKPRRGYQQGDAS